MKTLKQIESIVCKYYEVNADDLKKADRSQYFTTPRQIAMYLSKKYTKHTFDTIGRHYNRDHSTVIFSHGKICDFIKNDKKIRFQINELEEIIESENQHNDFRRAIIADIQEAIKKLNSGNISHHKLSMGQVCLNIEKLL